MSYANSNLPSLGTYVGNKVRAGKIFAGGQYDQAINYDVSPPAYVNNNMPYNYTNGAPGAQISPWYTYVIQPNPLSGTCIVDAQTLSSGGYLTIEGDLSTGSELIMINGSPAVKLDYARVLLIQRTGTTGSPNVFVWGLDIGGVPMFEQINFEDSATTANGNKAFFIITNVYVSTADTWSVGVGYFDGNDVVGTIAFGLPFYVPDFGFLNSPTWDRDVLSSNDFIAGQALNTTATATTNDVRGLITLPNDYYPAGEYLVINMYVVGADNDNDDVSLLLGVPQYNQVLMPGV